MKEQDGARLGQKGSMRQPQIPSHTCTRPRAEAVGLDWVILNVRSHGSTAFPYPGPAGGPAQEGGHNQQFCFSAHRLPAVLSSRKQIQLLPCVI